MSNAVGFGRRTSATIRVELSGVTAMPFGKATSPATWWVGAVGCDQGDDFCGRESRAGHHVETHVIDVGIAAAVRDDLVPSEVRKAAQIGMNHQRAVGLPAQNAPAAHDDHASIRQEVHAQGKGWLANHDLVLAIEIDGENRARPSRKPRIHRPTTVVTCRT